MGRHQQPHQTQVFVSFFVTGCINANTHCWPATTDPRRRIFITSSPNGSNRFITLEWSVWGGGTVDDDSDSRLVSLATHVSKLWRRLSVQLSLYTRFVLLSECHTRLVYRRPSSFAWAVGHRRTKPRRTFGGWAVWHGHAHRGDRGCFLLFFLLLLLLNLLCCLLLWEQWNARSQRFRKKNKLA